MINIEQNHNTVYISIIQTGCITKEFDSTYPTSLNGIISPEEFTKSMNKINSTVISKRKTLTFLRIVLTMSIIAGVIVIIISSIKRRTEDSKSLFLPLSIAGIGITAVGSIFYIIAFCIVQSKRNKRMRQAIAEESIKYSSKSPISCNWRSEANHLVIDIDHSKATICENQVFYTNRAISEPTLYIE